MALVSISMLSLNLPSPLLQSLHSQPRNLSVAWSWSSTMLLLPLTCLWQIGHRRWSGLRFSLCSLARTLPCCLRHSVQVCLRRMPLDRVLLIGNSPSRLIWWQTLHSRWSWWPCQCAFNMVLVLTWWPVWPVGRWVGVVGGWRIGPGTWGAWHPLSPAGGVDL